MELDTTRFWDERLAADFSLKGVGYKALGEDFNRWMYRLRARVFLKYAPRNVHRVLDIGSGTGFYCNLWRKLGASVLPSDISKVPADRLSGVVYDVTDGTLPERFDAISAMDILFHIVDDEKYERAYANIAAMLQPAGYFVFTENVPDQEVRHAHHVSRTRATVMRLLERQGLKVVLEVPLFHLMNQSVGKNSLWWRFVLKLAPRLPFLGAFLYPIELALVGLPSHSTKMFVAVKY